MPSPDPLPRRKRTTTWLDRALEGRVAFLGIRKGRKKPPEAGLPVMAVPPRGPMPLQGGAEAPLEFDD